MTRNARALVWTLLLLGTCSAVVTVLFTLAALAGDGGTDTEAAVSNLFLALPGITFSAVGGLLLFRRPGNNIGWLSLTIGVVWLTVGASDSLAVSAASHGRPALASWVGAVGVLWVPALGLMGTHVPLRLPDGDLLSPRWRWFSRFCTVVIVLTTLAVIGESSDVTLPAASALVLVLVPVCFIVALTSLVLRYRRSAGAQRAQMRVIAVGGLLFVGTYLTAISLLILLVPEPSPAASALTYLVSVAYCAVPVAIGVAVFRYRLYDLDLVLNRALVYGALSAILAAAYVAGVLLLQFALSPVTSRSDLAVAGSTLFVAGLFGPARRRIQGLVDHRFYRRRYDAARTLDAFGGRLREELDLEALGADLRGVVATTLQPTQVSLWLRP